VIVLQDEPDLPAQVPVVQRLEIDSVVEDRSFGRLQQSGQTLDERRLAGAATADDGDVPAGRDVE